MTQQPPFNKPASPYEDLKHNNPWWYSRPMAVVVAGVIVLGALYLFWHLMMSNTEELGEENIPLITADTTPLTLPPSDDDRVQNPHTDKAVYGLISDTKPVTPQLKASGEEPILIQATPQNTEASNNLSPPSNEMDVLPAPSAQGSYAVQIASLPARSLAETEQKKIEKKYADLLTSVPSTIVEKSIQDKGTFFRVCYGSFTTKAEAQALCQKLKERGVSCLVTSL